jgi:transposase, IS5 family
MRRITRDPELFRPRHLGYKRAGELAAIDRILVANPQAAELVWNDLQGRVAKTGRPGLSADQVLRAAIVKQIYGFSYEDLAFHLADSQTYRNFCGFYLAEQAPKKSSLASNIKRVKAATWEKINRILLDYAKEEGLEDGLRVRIDATVTETNIHPPTDNKLLFDCVRVFDRLLREASRFCEVSFPRRIRRAKPERPQPQAAPRSVQRLAQGYR